MKVDLAELSRAYQGRSNVGASPPGGDCPSPERLADCVFSRVSRKERAAVLEHAARCPDCARALKCALDISGETDGFFAKLKALDAEARRGGRRERGRLLWGFLPRPALAVVATVFAVAAVGFAVIRLTQAPGVRGGEAPAIRALAPINVSAPSSDIHFRWETVKDADHYFVEVFDSAFRLLWRSGSLRTNETDLPAAAQRDVAAGGTYFWLVTGVTGDARKIQSGLSEFSIKK